jgi:type I restriction enzyme R subunit
MCSLPLSSPFGPTCGWSLLRFTTGFGVEQLAEMQKIIDAEDSDLFDLLAHVAYSKIPLTREVRAAQAKVYINSDLNSKQQAFLDFVLQHYVAEVVEELE